MRLSVPWTNFVVFGSLTLLAIGAALFTILSGMRGEALLAMLLCSSGFVIVFGAVLATWWFTGPSYITKQGVGVWVAGEFPSKPVMEHYLDLYVTEMGRAYPAVSQLNLQKMLDGTTIEWFKDKVSAMGIGWFAKNKAGLQKGKCIKVQAYPGICDSALTHELAHEIQEVIQGKPIDYAHEDTPIWIAVDEATSKIRSSLEVE